MDALLLLAVEADKEARRKSEPVCKMAGAVDDVQKAVVNIAQSVGVIQRELSSVAGVADEARDYARKAANKKPQKASDYVMEVERGEDGKISRIDVRAV